MKKLYTYVILGVTILTFAIILIMLSPRFNIETIEINGIKRLEKPTIIKCLGLENKTNILSFNKIKAKNILMKNNYIESLEIKKILPSTLVLNIKEREITGYIPYINDFLYIDKNGFVVDIKPNYTEKLPLITGLEFESFNLGKVLKVDNEDTFKVVMEFSTILSKKEIKEDIFKIDVSNLNEISLYANKIKVILGNKKNLGIKINTLIEIVKNIPIDTNGILYINDIEKTPIFKFLT